MSSSSDISRKAAFFDQKAKAERLAPPQMAQETKAVRHPVASSGIRRAFCKNDPGAISTITCYLDVDGTGTEITVHCDINDGSTALNTASPRLKGGTGTPKTGGTPIAIYKDGDTWRASTLFGADKECICTEP